MFFCENVSANDRYFRPSLYMLRSGFCSEGVCDIYHTPFNAPSFGW